MINTLEEITKTPTSSVMQNPLVDRIIGLFQKWPWFLISVVFSLASAFIYLRYSTPMYEISSSILVKDDTKGTDLGEAAILENLGLSAGKNNIDNEVEVLKSRTLMENVVHDLQLQVSYFAKGKIKTTEIFETSPIALHFFEGLSVKSKLPAKTYSLQLGKENRFTLSDNNHTWQQVFGDTLLLPEGRAILKKKAIPANNDDSYLISINGMDETAQKYIHSLQVSASNKQVSIISLKLKDILPLKGETILSKLIENYLQASVLDKSRIADSTIAFIDQNLTLVSQELRGVEDRIEKYRTTNHITDFTEQARLLLQNSSNNAKEETDINIQLSIIGSLLTYVQQNPLGIIPSSIVMQHPGFVASIDKYNETQLLRDRTQTSSTAAHPVVQNLDEQLRNLRLGLVDQIRNRQKELELNRKEIRQDITGLNTQINSIPARERVYLDNARQQQIKQELYVFLLKKRVETSISKSSTLANGRIIDKPKADEHPVFPNHRLTILVALLIGLFIPVAFFNIQETFSIRLTNKKQVTDAIPASVIGEIGCQQPASKSIARFKANGQVGEQFRILRTNLQFISSIKKDKIILITSSMAGEGKTFIAINLCKTLSMAGKKVILVECDLRRPQIGKQLDIHGKTGLTHYIISDIPLSEVIQQADIPNPFDVITAGLLPPNPAELLLSDRVTQMVNQLRIQYDYIILDTAPFGIVTDAHVLSQHAEISLYVVRQNFTFRNQLESIQEICKNKILPKLHLVLNDVKLHNGYHYGKNYQS